jgi:O-antigen/teichoic acid export membrane protein
MSDSLRALRKDCPLVVSQLLLLASTTLGTVIVGALADASTTAAYAAIEKLFNLGATVLVGFYMVLHPRFAAWFYQDRSVYWKRTQYLLATCAVGGVCLALLLNWVGGVLLNLYLPAHLAAHVLSVMVPFALWLGLCMGQHVLTGYLVFAERNDLVLWVNAGVLFATLLAGYFCARLSPVTWVYGMLIGQILVMLLLIKLRHDDKVVCL